MGSGKIKYHIMMVILVIVWGLELSIAKDALESVDAFVILNTKFFFGALLIAAVSLKSSGFQMPKAKDIPLIVLSALVGHVMFFYCEYAAMDTVPVANITIIYGLLPILSAVVEKLFFHRRFSARLAVFMVFLIFGLFLVIGSDFSSMRGGTIKGYLFCAVALFAWLAYLFLTESLAEKYGSVKTALYQSSVAWVLTIPGMVPHISEFHHMGPLIIAELLYLGLFSEGLCFLIEVAGLEKLGPTVTAVYSNFLPVSTALFGFLLLGQDLVLLQIIGGVVVIASGLFVIREKDRIDRLG